MADDGAHNNGALNDSAHNNGAPHDRTSGDRAPIRAPRGGTLNTRGWQQEAALRMLMNNLDPEVAEHPERARRLRRHRQGGPRLALVRRDRAHAHHPAGRRDAAGAVGPAGRRHAHPRVGAAGADRQLQPRRRLGELGGVPPAGGARADDVRPDDRRLVDLHRHPGHPAGHVRDVRGGRGQAVRRHPRRHASRSPPASAAWAAPSRSPSP